MFLSSGDICSKTIRLNKIKDTITFNNSSKTLLLQAECNLLRICDSAWELLLGRDVCSMTREQKKAINIPQGDHDNSKTSRNSHIWFDGQESWGSTLRFARCWFFRWRCLCMDVAGAVPGATREYTGLLSQLNWQLSVGRDCSAYCRWFFFFMLLLFCNSDLQNSCWSDFSWDGVVARARTLHLPSSTLLPATCVSFCTLLIVRNSDSLKTSLGIISSKSGFHVVPLSFKILGSNLHLSLMWKTCPPLSGVCGPSELIYEFAALFT